MKTFQYIARDYTPSVDLEVLGKTYDTLEQGHKEAIKAASDLETVVANLDMNEAEDGFKQQLINEIKDTIDNNTIYGNSYGALDDLILKSGNIASDGRIIGKLRNQKAKKEYDAKVDAMAINEGMKQMYKEENPYYYKDGGVDKNTGRYLPGEMWKPTTTPVATVSDAEIQKYALQIAAKDAGSGESISFLDANGKPTPDPNQSEDGTIYKKVGSKWERLSEDKIKQAYDVAINSIPGAKDSLSQDYRYEKWKYDKAVDTVKKEGKDTVPYVKGFTDRNGNIYTEEQWLNNKINNFADVAAYNHVYSSVDYGPALANRQARKQQAAAMALITAGGANQGFGTMIVGTKEVEGNAFAGAQEAKTAANAQGLKIIKRLLGDKAKGFDSLTDAFKFAKSANGSYGPNTAINYFIKNFGNKMSDTDKINLINSINGYYKANSQISKMINAAGKDADGVKFGSNVYSQEYTNDNKYGKSIINELNRYFKNYKTANWQVGSQIMDGIASKYGTTIQGLKQMGFTISKRDDGNYDVTIDANNRMLLPKFASVIREVNNEIPGTIGGFLKNKFTTGVSSTNYYEYGTSNRGNKTKLVTNSLFGHVANIYEKGIEASNNANKKVGIAKGTITYNGVDDGSFASLWYRENGKALGLTDSDIRAEQKLANERVDNMFANGNFDSGNIEYIDASGNTTKSIADNQDAKTIIQKMYRNDTWRNQIKRSCIVPSGGTAGQPLGYAIGFTVPKGAETGKFKEGETYTFVVSGIMKEETNYNPSANPDILARNVMITSKATGSNIENIGYNSDLGDTRIIPSTNEKYNTSMFGNTRQLGEEEATKLTSLMYTLENIKSQYQAGLFSTDNNRLLQLSNSLKVISDNIASITNKNPADIELMIGNYMLNIE